MVDAKCIWTKWKKILNIVKRIIEQEKNWKNILEQKLTKNHFFYGMLNGS